MYNYNPNYSFWIQQMEEFMRSGEDIEVEYGDDSIEISLDGGRTFEVEVNERTIGYHSMGEGLVDLLINYYESKLKSESIEEQREEEKERAIAEIEEQAAEREMSNEEVQNAIRVVENEIAREDFEPIFDDVYFGVGHILTAVLDGWEPE